MIACACTGCSEIQGTYLPPSNSQAGNNGIFHAERWPAHASADIFCAAIGQVLPRDKLQQESQFGTSPFHSGVRPSRQSQRLLAIHGHDPVLNRETRATISPAKDRPPVLRKPNWLSAITTTTPFRSHHHPTTPITTTTTTRNNGFPRPFFCPPQAGCGQAVRCCLRSPRRRFPHHLPQELAPSSSSYVITYTSHLDTCTWTST